jgi:hypothetical protein
MAVSTDIKILAYGKYAITCLIKHTRKPYGGEDVKLQAFFFSALNGVFNFKPRPLYPGGNCSTTQNVCLFPFQLFKFQTFKIISNVE